MDNDMGNELNDDEFGEIYEANSQSEILDIDFNIENYDKNKI